MEPTSRPKGFAHGFVKLVPNTEVAYKVTDYYSPDHDRSIRFDDSAIGISWPEELSPFQLSAKDKEAPLLAKIDTGFEYELSMCQTTSRTAPLAS